MDKKFVKFSYLLYFLNSRYISKKRIKIMFLKNRKLTDSLLLGSTSIIFLSSSWQSGGT